MISLDLETTGLDPRRHEAWEIGLVTEDAYEYLWEFPVRNLGDAEAGALQVSGYYDRRRLRGVAEDLALPLEAALTGKRVGVTYISCEEAARDIAELTVGERLMGCAIQFDMSFLTALLQRYGAMPAWHHRALDLGSYAAGCAGAREPFASRTMAERVPNEEAHTALGDARWNWAAYRHFAEVAGVPM